MNAKGESYCICTQEYTGDLCEKKTGCYGDPCKYGKCKNDPNDMTKFTCKCDEGIVGPKCDISKYICSIGGKVNKKLIFFNSV